MRVSHLLPFIVLSSVACGTAATGEESVSTSSKVTSGTSCSVSRAEILASTSAMRQEAIARGFAWLDDDVPYSQSASHEGYRTDCSGFVSMCWDLGKSSNTSALVAGDSNTKLGSYEELAPAAARLKSGHVVLFLAWNDDAHTGACVLEQSSTKNDMQFRVRTVASLKKEGYKAVRATKMLSDTGEPELTKGAPANEPPLDLPVDDPTVCTSRSALEVCMEARDLFDVECGTIEDECGRLVRCDGVGGLGCGKGEKCDARTNMCEVTRPAPSGEPSPSEREDEPSPEVSDADESEGDPGDETTPASKDSDDDEDEDDDDSSPRSKRSAATASAGCSASAQGAGSGALPFVGIARARGRLRRRDGRALNPRRGATGGASRTP